MTYPLTDVERSLYYAGRIGGVGYGDAAFEKSASYIIRKNGSYYEAINGSTGKIDYGGSNNAGGVDGTDASTVIQTTITALSNGGTILRKQAIYDLGTTQLVISQNWKGLELIDEPGVETKYSGADYAIEVTGARNVLKLWELDLDSSGAKGILINDSSNVVDVRLLEGHDGSASQHGVVVEATNGKPVYLCDVKVRESDKLDDVLRIVGFDGSNMVNLNFFDVRSLGATINRGGYMNQYCADNLVNIYNENGDGLYCDGQRNRGKVYSAAGGGKTGIEFGANAASNDFTLDFNGAGTSVTDGGTLNTVFNIATGYYGTLRQFTGFSAFREQGGYVKAAPGVNYIIIDNCSAFMLDWDKFKPNKVRIVFTAQGNEAGAGKGIELYDSTSAAQVCEKTWDGNALQSGLASNWTAFTKTTGDRGYHIRVKGSSGTENITIYYVDVQFS